MNSHMVPTTSPQPLGDLHICIPNNDPVENSIEYEISANNKTIKITIDFIQHIHLHLHHLPQ